jgi:CRISPR-associated protein Csb1
MNMTTQFDSWLSSDGPVALTIVEPLEPATGDQGVFFPPTFAPPARDEKPSYVIDANGTCLVDSVGSQANRLEPIFKRPDLSDLVPAFIVKAGNRQVDLLDAGHRAADAIVRFSDQWKNLRDAFLEYRDQGHAQKLAKIAPTSLVFGVWDSRDTGTKVPRLVESTIRAYGVQPLTRSAQYFSVLEKEEINAMGLDELGDALSEHGLLDSPATGAPGGVIAKDGIRREALLNLVALRALGASDMEATRKLQRYVLGLALVAFIAPTELYLRQGCVLVGAPGKPAVKKEVLRNGERKDLTLTEEQVIAYAKACAKEFGVGNSVHAEFNPKLVHDAVNEKASKKKAKATAKV